MRSLIRAGSPTSLTGPGPATLKFQGGVKCISLDGSVVWKEYFSNESIVWKEHYMGKSVLSRNIQLHKNGGEKNPLRRGDGCRRPGANTIEIANQI